MSQVSERRLMQVSAIVKACELDGIECSIRVVAKCLGMSKSARVNELCHLASKHGFIKLLEVIGDNGLKMYLLVPTDHFIYETLTDLIAKYRQEVYS